jgi:hypothetical protein
MQAKRYGIILVLLTRNNIFLYMKPIQISTQREWNMSLGANRGTCSEDYGAQSPFFLSVYVLDALKRGRLFEPSTFDTTTIDSWISNFILEITNYIPLPSRLKLVNVQELLWKNFTDPERRTALIKRLEEMDSTDEKSIKKLLHEEKEEANKTLTEMEESIRQNDFPPYLWMEYDRFRITYNETTCFFEELILKIAHFKPKHKSQMHQRSRQARASTHVYFDLIESYFGALLGYYRLCLLIEVWSCQKKEDVFTPKCIWTYSKINENAFKQIFAEFHVSISRLQQSFFRFKRGQEDSRVIKPVDWAFKQLILMT